MGVGDVALMLAFKLIFCQNGKWLSA